jgi:hypothetical protein
LLERDTCLSRPQAKRVGEAPAISLSVWGNCARARVYLGVSAENLDRAELMFPSRYGPENIMLKIEASFHDSCRGVHPCTASRGSTLCSRDVPGWCPRGRICEALSRPFIANNWPEVSTISLAFYSWFTSSQSKFRSLVEERMRLPTRYSVCSSYPHSSIWGNIQCFLQSGSCNWSIRHSLWLYEPNRIKSVFFRLV